MKSRKDIEIGRKVREGRSTMSGFWLRSFDTELHRYRTGSIGGALGALTVTAPSLPPTPSTMSKSPWCIAVQKSNPIGDKLDS